MKYKIIILLLFLSCKNKDNEIGKPEKYILSEKEISEDCSVYQMKFYKGEYIFRFALSGACKKISIENYIKEYSEYLFNNHDSLVNKRGLIIIEHNELNKNNKKKIQDSIIGITEKYFKRNIFLYEKDESSFILKVSE
jgi:hypothetical protein